MRVLLVSGIWPPDVGGPASHAPQLAEFLSGRGHRVEVVTTADAAPAPEGYAVHWVSRGLPRGLRHLAVAVLAARRARRAAVVYSTGMFARTQLAALVARRPVVVKLTGDPAFERARWRGVVAGDVDAFQAGGGGLQSALLRRVRDLLLRRADHVFCPSAYLRELALCWGLRPERVEVLPNPAPAPLQRGNREELRRRLGLNGPTLVFAGRLTPQKALGDALSALAEVDGVRLVIAGEGPEQDALERSRAELGLGERVSFLGARPREEVLDLLRAADAALLSSGWENFPHAVVEALSVGTPVLATAVGGVEEVVADGENGLLVPPGDPAALAAAIRRFLGDEELRARLRAAAAPSVEEYRADRLLGRVEDVLERVARP